MKSVSGILIILALLASPALAAEPDNWRLQLLAEEGFDLQKQDLPALQGDFNATEKHFLELVPLLASEDFATREGSQRKIIRMGNEARPWLDKLPPSEDPEITLRIAQIREELSKNQRWSKGELVRFAVSDLLREKNGVQIAKGTPLVFTELFRDNAPELGEKYRHFSFDCAPGLSAKVSDGVLRLAGNGGIEGDQRLILTAAKISGAEVFPDKFKIEVMLQGNANGAGGYHLGVSIGKVRALFHPGYRGGGFRFEHVDTHKPLTENKDMGFTPAADAFTIMAIEAKHLPDGDTELLATVSPDDKRPTFQTRIKVPAASIGKLDSISLDRSGRQGGDAVFDNLVVEMTAP